MAYLHTSTAYPDDIVCHDKGEQYATAYREDPQLSQSRRALGYPYQSQISADETSGLKEAEPNLNQISGELYPLKMPSQQFFPLGSGQTSAESEFTEPSQEYLPTEKQSVQSLSLHLSQKRVVVASSPKDPSTNFPLAILATILFCPVTGAFAILYAVFARKRIRIGHMGAAAGYGCISLCFSIVSIVIGMSVYIVIIVIAATRYRLIQYGYGN